MSNLTPIPTVPHIHGEEYEVEAITWAALKQEIDQLAPRIMQGEYPTQEEVRRARELHKQIEGNLEAFKRAIQQARDTYITQVTAQLEQIGYPAITSYVARRNQEVREAQIARAQAKLTRFQTLIQQLIEETVYVKQTALTTDLLTPLYGRFPKITSAAVAQEITDAQWVAYEQVIRQTFTLLDGFFADVSFAGASELPINSYTMRHLVEYIRTGDVEPLRHIRTCFEQDAPLLADIALRKRITSRAQALIEIRTIMDSDAHDMVKLERIQHIIGLTYNIPIERG